MLVRLEGDGTLSQQLYRGLRSAILAGRFPPRTRLPSTRALSRELGVSRNVVLLAFEQLHAEGYLDATIGSGTFVSARLPEAMLAPWAARDAASAPAKRYHLSRHARTILELRPLPPPGSHPRPGELRWDFRYGVPSIADLPHAVWSRLVARRARAMTLRTLRYGMARGYLPLREEIVAYLRRARGVVADVEQLVIVNGTQQALDLATRLLIDPGDRVVIEEPSYQAARQVFLGAGARLVPTSVDEDGLVVGQLPRGRVRLAYVTPSHQFPLGGVMPIARRLELLQWAERAGAYVIEDDYDSEFRYIGRPTEAVQGLDRAGCVLYIGTFSKVMFPSLRVGYLVLPKPLVPAAAALKFLMDYHTPTFEQEVLADFLREGHFERHLRRVRLRNLARRDALINALRGAFGDAVELLGTDAGIHLVARFRQLAASALPALVLRASDHGVGVYPITPYYVRAPSSAGLLFGYACLDERQIRAGVRALAVALDL